MPSLLGPIWSLLFEDFTMLMSSFYQHAALRASWSRGVVWVLGLFRGYIVLGTYIIDAIECISEVILDLWGHLEAIRASEATKIAFRGIMQMLTGVLEGADFKSLIEFWYAGYIRNPQRAGLWGHRPLVGRWSTPTWTRTSCLAKAMHARRAENFFSGIDLCLGGYLLALQR